VLDRREFLSTAVGRGTRRLPIARAAAPKRGFTEQAYAKAIVIDALGGPAASSRIGPNRFLREGLADAKASGVTAVNLTVNSVGNGPRKFEETVAEIAVRRTDDRDHPDHFMKVLNGADLKTAKDSGRMGFIYGFQDTSSLDGDLSVSQSSRPRRAHRATRVQPTQSDGRWLPRAAERWLEHARVAS
jgi:membrane dipeptidase